MPGLYNGSCTALWRSYLLTASNLLSTLIMFILRNSTSTKIPVAPSTRNPPLLASNAIYNMYSPSLGYDRILRGYTILFSYGGRTVPEYRQGSLPLSPLRCCCSRPVDSQNRPVQGPRDGSLRSDQAAGCAHMGIRRCVLLRVWSELLLHLFTPQTKTSIGIATRQQSLNPHWTFPPLDAMCRVFEGVQYPYASGLCRYLGIDSPCAALINLYTFNNGAISTSLPHHLLQRL